MTSRVGVIALVLAGGCCKQSVNARAFVGNISDGACLERLNQDEYPQSIMCPGEEVTVCWKASGDNVTGTKITVSPDPGALSHAYGATGALHFKPQANTTVKIDAVTSDCASTTKQITVINGVVPMEFDAQWDLRCTKLLYSLDPAYVSPNVKARDDLVKWNPTVSYTDSNGNTYVANCTTPPFLKGFHVPDSFGFTMDTPFVTETFANLHNAAGEWDYQWLAQCPGDGLVCESGFRAPFVMNLVCP